MTPEVNNFKQIIVKFLDSYKYNKIQTLNLNETDNQPMQIMEQIENIIDSMEETRSSMSYLQEELVKIPALTGKFKRARRTSANILGQLIAEIAFAIDHAKEIYKEYEQIYNSDS
jgi:uncharacterized membrane protein YjjP (DUF1212 family)